MKVPPIVDAHHHFWWNPSQEIYPWMTEDQAVLHRTFDPDVLRPELARAGVDFTVIVQTQHNVQETRHFLEIASNTDFVAGVVGWVDLTDTHVEESIRALREGPHGRFLVGIRHIVHDEPDPNWLLRSDVRNGLAALNDAEVPYDLLVRTRELPAALDVVRRFPTMRFVIDHIAKPPMKTGAIGPWIQAMEPFSDLPNVSCKVSGLITEADHANWVIEDLIPATSRILDWFGADRLMFGSDWPVCLLAGSYEEVFQACRAVVQTLPPEDQTKIFGSTAIEFYGLDKARGDR